MAHETHHDHHDAHTHHTEVETRPTTSYWSAFWFVLILAGLFVAAVNFVGVMGHSEEGHGTAGHGGEHPKEATSSQTLEGETGVGVDAAHTTQHHGSNTAADTTHTEGHAQEQH